ncbi:DUF427 domain-containing protein [Terrabacter terrigena]|uniref:DUF427 domain-containing protein n=1 Tax=Terrabacter terrigena TaxID=574718 RepID=A0ABW3MVN2_9MICO
MTIDLRSQQREQRDQLRYASTAKRLRASRSGALVRDTTEALVVWLPRHVVPQYAVPRDALGGRLPDGAIALEGDGVDGHVLLPFGCYDWLEEDEPVIGPRDPFSRIDVLHSTHDVRTELLVPSDTRTTCAYKGHATYLSAAGENGRDIASCYRSPLRDAEPVRDLLCFWAERTVTTVDGVREHGITRRRPADA